MRNRARHRAFGTALAVALAGTAPIAARAVPTLSICMHTEGESGEQSDCPAPSLDAAFRFYNSTWQPSGPQLAIVHDAVSATWSVLSAEASVYAKYGASVSSGFTNDNNRGNTRLDADDFVITGPAGPVSFRLHVYVNGHVHSSSTDYQRFTASAAVNVTGNIIKANTSHCSLTIAGGTANSAGTQGYGVWAADVGGPALFTSDPCTVNTGEAFRILIDVSASASLVTILPYDLPSPGAQGSASARVTAGFPAYGPVFELPVGYTAYSAAAEVEDNGYVPEPAAASLSSSACAALLALHRRRTAIG